MHASNSSDYRNSPWKTPAPPKKEHYLLSETTVPWPLQQTRCPDTNAEQSEDFTTLAKRESQAVGFTKNVQTMGGWFNVFRS